jgi:exopolysaccharide biosynthesis WecB/TagA/CpsF family protein/anti-anti-sigma factor
MRENELALPSENLFQLSAPASSKPFGPECCPRRGITLLGIPFEHITLAEAVRRIEEMVDSGHPHYVVTPNVDFLVQARRDAELRRILIEADLAVCDGTPVRWASRLLGNALPERVAGADLVPWLIQVAAEKNYRLFFLGGTPEANEAAVANLRARFPRVNIAGHYSPPFQPLHEMDHDEIARRVRAARPDLLFVSFGCPKAEKWIATHYLALEVPVTIGVGATIDFLAGRVKRAPVWMQRAGLEWVFRLCQEPRRLFRRYATDLWHFSWGIGAQWWRTRSFLKCRRGQLDSPRVIVEPTWQRIQLPRRLNAEAVRRGARAWEQASTRHCLLDLGDVQVIDSTGVGLLLDLRKKLRATGRCLVLLAPSKAVRQILKWMRIHDLFLTAEDALGARSAIKSQVCQGVPMTESQDWSPAPRLPKLESALVESAV